jgi:LCP family protein required for cell wall assembly
MGLDGNASQGRYRRADSLIVASFDPATNSAVLIGVPRDVYVTIHSPKGAIRNRINTAYVWGELYNYPGGGPALQMRTVGELLGLPIHHYVSVYFDGFAKLIDAIGGIDINVPTALRDNFTGWSFNAGMQHMDGKKALQYARSRYSTSDFSRGRRQQLVILAAVEKMTKAGILPKLPAVLPTVTEAFRSDMSIPDLLALASLGYKIDRSQIKTAQVDETMVQSWRTPEGAAVLLPRNDRIKTMVQSALTPLPAPTPTSVPSPAPATASAASGQTPTAPGTQPAPTAPAPTAAPLAADAYRSEQARVEVLNGTNRIGLARATQSSLQAKGVQVVRIADATGIYKQTVLYDDGSKPATRDYLVKLLNIKPENVRALQPGGVNLRIILGTDFKVP